MFGLLVLLVLLVLLGLLGLLAGVVPPVQPRAAEVPSKQPDVDGRPPALEPWVRRVHALVVRSVAPLSRTLPGGAYVVHFSIDEEGRGSRYGVEGNVGAAQAAVIAGALAAHAFPAPPDGASHAMSFTVRVK